MRHPMSSSRSSPYDVRQVRSHPIGAGRARRDRRRRFVLAGVAVVVVLVGPVRPVSTQPQKGAVTDPGAATQNAVLGATSVGSAAARQFQCLSRDAQGNCTRNKCTRGPGGQFYDCGTFAQACKNAGLDWTGSREGDEAGGVCSIKKKAPQ
jgi:hypothetical protein